MTVLDEAVDSLVAAAADGVRFDGLVATRDGDAFRLAVPGVDREGLPEPAFREAARRNDVHVTEWYVWERLAPDPADRRAFLRWVERADDRAVPERRTALADGVARTWGQLRVAVTADASGVRTYELRHASDADEPVAALSTVEGSRDLRQVVRSDDRGRYRPLSTAPTLPTGWVVPDRGPGGLVRAVEAVYPASIADWYRERTGDLDVTHWRETADRQTGIYDAVDELSGDPVAWLAEACCVDSRCLKRREWDESPGSGLDVPRGEGAIPCREPCSLVVAAAREVLAAGADGARTPSAADRAAIDRTLAAVAGDEDVRLGDLDDAANPLRAGYLRAKLADEGWFDD